MRNDPLLGTLVAGRFLIRGVLGEGSSGLVYLAEHARRGTRHAVKVLHANLEDDDWVVERFRREALAASRLDHPNIVFIEDFGQAPDGQLYLVMPYVPGTSLDKVMSGAAPAVLPYPRVLRILGQVADGLAAAHDQAIVHRDVKPGNILLHVDATGAETVMMLDFGLAKILVAPDLSVLTQKGEVFGTPGYMSPEQAAGDEVDTRTDIYSFGVMAYELFTGRLPFEAKTLPQLLVAHLKVTPRPVESLRPPEVRPLPPALAAAVMRCLEKDPDRRPDRISEVGRVLARCQAALGQRDLLRESLDGQAPDEARIQRQWQTAETLEAPAVELTATLAERGAAPTAGEVAATAFAVPDDGRSFRWGALCEQARELAEAMSSAGEGVAQLGRHLARIAALEADIIAAERELERLDAGRARAEQEQRDLEAQLRHAVVDLSLERDRLLHGAGDPAILADLDYQIAALEARLQTVCAEHTEARAELVAALEARRRQLAEAHRELTTSDLQLLHLLGRKPPTARAPAALLAAYEALAARMG